MTHKGLPKAEKQATSKAERHVWIKTEDPLSNREKFPGEKKQLCAIITSALLLEDTRTQCLNRLPLDVLRDIKEALGLSYQVEAMPEVAETPLSRVQAFVRKHHRRGKQS